MKNVLIAVSMISAAAISNATPAAAKQACNDRMIARRVVPALRSARDRKFRRSAIGRLFQLQNNWTGYRVSDTKAAAEIFKCVAERI